MDFLFGKRKTPQEMLREHQRGINRAIREIDRERVNLQNQEKRTIVEIKKLAKQGQMGAAKIMARDLVRTRAYIQKFYKMRAELQAVSMRIVTLKSTAAMGDAMKGATRAMMMMSRQMNLPQLQRIMMEFAKQSDAMDMKQEMMSDTMDDVMGEDGEEEESEQVVNQVLDEIGISLGQELADTPSGTVLPAAAAPARAKAAPVAAAASSSSPSAAPSAAAPSAPSAGGSSDDDLEARLNALKRP